VLVDGFNKHYRLFRESSALAKQRFEQARWQEVQQAVRDRIQFYDDRVRKPPRNCIASSMRQLSDSVWQQAKLQFIGLLTNHKQPELAETFFNSVFCQILHRTYFHNDFIFVRPAVSTEYIESDPPTYRCYYPNQVGFRLSIRQVFVDFCWAREFEDMDRDVEFILRSIGAPIWNNTGARGQSADSGAQLGLLQEQGRLRNRQGGQWCDRVSVYGSRAAFGGRQTVSRHHHPRRMADQRVVFAVAGLFHGRHGCAFRLRSVSAFDHAQQAALRALHHARVWASRARPCSSAT
jgi:hypothetical protein